MSTPARLMRDRYKTDNVGTANPAKLITMMYDRMVVDLEYGIAAIERGDREECNHQIQHAQAILMELLGALDQEAWSGGPALAGIYVFLTNELLTANLHQDVAKVRSCLDLLTPLQDAWQQAVALAASDA
ncbi:MAG: flagellar export chaperone FliS [Acidobacteria bacterium]|nr:flagellar export chaperone FliS [Acidobacteriota bacterium]